MDNIVVSDYENLKSAALYFDGVIPAFNHVMLADDPSSSRRIEELLTGKFVSDGEAGGRMICEEVIRISDPNLSYEDVIRIVPSNLVDNYRNLLATQFALHLACMMNNSDGHVGMWTDKIASLSGKCMDINFNRLQIGNFPMIKSYDNMWNSVLPADDAGSDAIVTLSKLGMIDLSKVSWKHIHEIRSNPVAVTKLRRLRSFFRETYEDMSLEAISDDLHVRRHDYETEARRQGFALVDAVFEAVSETKGMLSVAGGILAAVGQPWGLAVCTIELGGIIVKVAETAMERNTKMASHPMAYFAHLNDQALRN